MIKFSNQKRIILRPHLSENIDYWKSKFLNHSNIMINSTESVHKWLANSEHHIHYNSTTAIEAALIGVPSHMIAIPEAHK